MIPLIEKNLIYLNSKLANRDEIIRKMSEDAKDNGMINDVDEYIAAVLKREAEVPTTVGFNVSIPHGKSQAVITPFITFMKTEKTFVWDEVSEEETQLIFMIGVPIDQKDTLHLRILAQISRQLMDESFRESLLSADTVEEAYQLIKSIENNIYSEEKGNAK